MAPRSTSRSTSDADDALVVGQIHGPHGVRGDVRVEPRSDVASRFAKGAVLQCDDVGPLTIASVRGEPSSRIIHFAGYDTHEAASTLRGKFLRVARSESRRATKGAYLWADLVGSAVVDEDGGPLGTVRDLLRAGTHDVLVVVDDAGRESLHPMIDTVVLAVDPEARRIVLHPQEELT